MKYLLETLLGIEGLDQSGALSVGLQWRPAGVVLLLAALAIIVYLRLGRRPQQRGWWTSALYRGAQIGVLVGLLAQVKWQLGQRLSLGWQSDWPGWAGVVLGAAGAAYVLWVYRRDGGPRPVRLLLAGLRAALVVLVLALIWRPMLVLQRTRVDPSEVVVLLDDSASLGITDRYVVPDEARHNARAAELLTGDDGGGRPGKVTIDALARKTRWELARDRLLRNDASVLKQLVKHNHMSLFTFSATAEPRATIADGDQLVDPIAFIGDHRPEGGSTNVPGAIKEALSQAKGRRVAAVILISDGRSTSPQELTGAVSAARKRSVPIHAVLLGSSVPPRDISLGPVYAQENVFVKDLVAFRTTVTVRGIASPTTCRAELLGPEDDSPLAAQDILVDPAHPQVPVELRHKPVRPGRFKYLVRVVPDPQEVQTDNNERLVTVNVIEENLRVLYVEGYPRYEYRYLKNALIREQTIRVSCLLLSADEEFPQEGNDPIRRFPETPEELAPYDVVLFGDVDPRHPLLSHGRLNMITHFVRDRGGGFGMIAGPRYAPQAYIGTPIEMLLPVVIDPQEAYRQPAPLITPFNPILTPEGQASPIFRLETAAEQSWQTFGQLPGLYWFARTAGLKPGAEGLAIHPTVETLSGPAPIVAVGRYGLGRTIFQAVDSTWRWRYHTGEAYFDTYWLQVARFLARNKLLGQGRDFILSADRQTYELGQPVTVQLEVVNSSRLSGLADKLAAVATTTAGKSAGGLELTRIGPQATTFQGSFIPSSQGSLTISMAGLGRSAGEELTTTIQVTQPNLEARVLAADHAALRTLAKQTGGKAVYLDELSDLATAIPDRSRLIPDDLSWPFWDTKLALLLFVLIIVTEWIVRKAYNLV